MKNELTIREPEMYFENIERDFNNFLRERFLPANPLNKLFAWRPAIEVKQNDKEYTVKVQLPGIKKDNIIVELDNDNLMTITAETHEEHEQDEQKKHNEHYHTSEFRYGKYRRTIAFDRPVKIEDADADYKNGVLKIIVPKQNPGTTETKRLEIK
jgi:HSP20 family protein